MPTKWDFYPEGTPLPEAGVTILKLLHAGLCMKDTQYLARFACCGTQAVINHHNVRRRIRNTVQLCNACAQRSREARASVREPRKTVPAIPAPVWAVPPGTRDIPFIW